MTARLDPRDFANAAELVESSFPGAAFELSRIQNAHHGIPPAGPGYMAHVWVLGVTGFGKDTHSVFVAVDAAIEDARRKLHNFAKGK